MTNGHLVPPLGPQDLRPRTDYAAGPRVSAVHRAGSQLTRSARLPDTWLSDTARSRKPAHQVRKAAGRLVKRCRDPNRRPAAAVRTVSRSNCPSRTPCSRFLFLVFASKAYRRAELPFPFRPVTGHTILIITESTPEASPSSSSAELTPVHVRSSRRLQKLEPQRGLQPERQRTMNQTPPNVTTPAPAHLVVNQPKTRKTFNGAAFEDADD
ncbi:hypothetical protein HPB51_010456 [Rhipicephalus microplus]|uniref:Uncharacterized protein n=1 Tax=Rhipicephalus microplus TaxID=6941 RepID=A0A9J6E0R5_RHIMP|nr:hypothetical protein HPB51_010456 [Rhipicephalus microplus]